MTNFFRLCHQQSKLTLIVALLLSSLPVFIIGSNYGWSVNHSTYLLAGLQMAHPELWPNDWWLNETTHYHFFFNYLVYAFEVVGITGPAFFILNILTITFSYFVIFKIIEEVWPARSLAIFSLVVLVSGIIRESTSIAITFLHISGFQPSSLPTLGLLVAMLLFIRGKYIGAGICLGFFNLLHANFAILTIPFFGIAHLCLGKQELFKRLVQQFVPQIILFIPLLPLILNTVDINTSAAIQKEALDILFNRHPYHYDFNYFSQTIPRFGGVLLLAILMYLYLYKDYKDNVRFRRFSALFFALVATFLFAFFEALIFNSQFINRFFLWRFCPFIEVFMYILISCGSIKIGIDIFQGKIKKYIRINEKNFCLSVVLIVSVIASIGAVKYYKACKFYVYNNTCHSDTSDFFRFIREETPINAIFLVHPDMLTFRLFAERSVVASSTEVPFTPSQTIEWFKRIQDMTGGQDIIEWKGLHQRYNLQSFKNLKKLRELYNIDYIVFNKKGEKGDGFRKLSDPVYEDNVFIVFAAPKNEQLYTPYE